MRTSLVGLVVLSSVSLSASEGPASYWGPSIAPEQKPHVLQPAPVDQALPQKEGANAVDQLAMEMFGGGPEQAKPQLCPQKKAPQAIAIDRSEFSTRPGEEDTSPELFSPGYSVVPHEKHPWRHFFSDSSGDSDVDELPVRRTKRVVWRRNVQGAEQPIMRAPKASKRIASKFKPHELFDLLQSEEGPKVLAPYFKGDCITPFEAYVTACWLKKHRWHYFDRMMDGCVCCPPATVLRGDCRCLAVNPDYERVERIKEVQERVARQQEVQCRIDRLKEKIAQAVVTVQDFVERMKTEKPIADESKRCNWRPAVKKGVIVPYEVHQGAERAKEMLHIGNKLLIPVTTGYEADVEDECAIAGGRFWNADEGTF